MLIIPLPYVYRSLYWCVCGVRARRLFVLHLYPQMSSSLSLQSIMNLTTEISALKFNCDGQILAAASQRKKDAFKLIHLPSATVYPWH